MANLLSALFLFVEESNKSLSLSLSTTTTTTTTTTTRFLASQKTRGERALRPGRKRSEVCSGREKLAQILFRVSKRKERGT